MEKQSGCSWQIILPPTGRKSVVGQFYRKLLSGLRLQLYRGRKRRIRRLFAVTGRRGGHAGRSPRPGIATSRLAQRIHPGRQLADQNVIRFPPPRNRRLLHLRHPRGYPSENFKNVLRIYAATAFGSGQHQTTRSCLELLSRLYHQGFVAANLLDMGCGSGILALSALKLWQNAAATAADIDEEAVIVTLQNAADNNLGHRITAAAGDGYANDKVLQNAPYDLIFQNILARPLAEMAPPAFRSAQKRRLCRFVRIYRRSNRLGRRRPLGMRFNPGHRSLP